MQVPGKRKKNFHATLSRWGRPGYQLLYRVLPWGFRRASGTDINGFLARCYLVRYAVLFVFVVHLSAVLAARYAICAPPDQKLVMREGGTEGVRLIGP